MKILLVVGLVLILAVVLYRVLRPVITLARQFLQTVRLFQQVSSRPSQPGSAAEKLIKCETCGVWTPESRTLSSGPLAYCSRECLKRAGRPRRKDTAA